MPTNTDIEFSPWASENRRNLKEERHLAHTHGFKRESGIGICMDQPNVPSHLWHVPIWILEKAALSKRPHAVKVAAANYRFLLLSSIGKIIRRIKGIR